jgi:hypothetical protein
MPHLIQISDNQHADLTGIKKNLEKRTGKPISFKIALDIYATKKPKTRITIKTQRGRPKLPQYQDFPITEINFDATIKKLLR